MLTIPNGHVNESRLPGSLKVALVRAPLISREGALNNEASPAIGLAYIAGYLLKKGHKVEIVDGTAADLGIVRPLKEYPGFQIQGIELDELVDRSAASVSEPWGPGPTPRPRDASQLRSAWPSRPGLGGPRNRC